VPLGMPFPPQRFTVDRRTALKTRCTVGGRQRDRLNDDYSTFLAVAAQADYLISSSFVVEPGRVGEGEFAAA